MRLHLYIIISAMMMVHSCKGDAATDQREDSTTMMDSTITLVFAGDMMSHMPQVKAAYNPQTKRHEYEH